MSCNCGGGAHFHEYVQGPGHDCTHINHAFDPNPPAFYGTWNHLYGHDCTNRVSVCQPGVASGLYRNNGPLQCPCQRGNVTMLTGVSTKAKLILSVTLTFTNSDMNRTIDIEPGYIYTITYLENGELVTATGLVSNIYKVEQLEEETNIYMITLDCSTNYAHNVIAIKSDQIRGISAYVPYSEEDSGLEDAVHNYGTTIAAVIKDAVVVDAELDENKNIIKGKIISGTLESAKTVDGVCSGLNSSKHNITLTNATSTNGIISGGYILNGVVRSGDIDGTKDPETGIVEHATIKGIITDVLIINSRISKATVESGCGTVVDPTLDNCRLEGATITGDIITTGGVTVGDITTGGITKGGTATGGTAFGSINGHQYAIIGGNTTGTLTTSGVVIGGQIIGGTKIGNAIYGATIKGGVCSQGITYGGTTTGGTLIPAAAAESALPKIEFFNKDRDKLELEKEWQRRVSHNNHDLVLMTDRATQTQLYTNFGTATIQEIDDLHRGNYNEIEE